ncbi:MAG: class I SAM-dependent methyltransferase [Nitrospirae bacterium]|nr:class I SAM-dependent methyltransferase [Nitrospirota bacterium]
MNSLQEPAKLLKDFLPILPMGKALDVAMGKGRNTIFLASHGFEVTGLERDEESIKICKDDAKTAGVQIDARCVDLEDLESYKIEKSAYDLVICFYYLQRNLFSRIKDALKPQGMIIYETFLIDQHIKTGHPRRREYCFEHNELLRLFPDFRILYYHEGQDSKGTYKAGLVAQKV